MSELGEKIVRILRIHNVQPGESYHAEFWKRHRGFIADEILALGLAELADNQALPATAWYRGTGLYAQGYRKAQQDMITAGFRKVELP